MVRRKGTSKTHTIVRRMSSAAPAVECVDVDPTGHADEPAEPDRVSESSLELLNGVRVTEAPMDTLPGELIDEFFEDSELHDPGAAALSSSEAIDDWALPAAHAEAGPEQGTLTLRPLDEPAAHVDVELPLDASQTVSASPHELVRSDPDLAWPSALDSAADTGHGAASGDSVPPEVARSAKKAARRAAVRHARIAAALRESGPTSGSPDLLVLDPNDGDRKQLCRLLEGFGFCVHSAQNIAQAGEMLAARAFAAVFLDIALDGTYQSAGAELCRRVKRARPPTVGQAPALIIISEGERPVDRVRATLAGGDRFLVKPLSRGDVARALEDCDVTLPLDARHG
ncbi:response regulator [Piscinibacter sp.]|jgi:CheY-like chemotaxis protein|uniref:response regulator n=1 Tax=Piscinibacter sp. TaxID=1903157 RepID=UPI002F420E45